MSNVYEQVLITGGSGMLATAIARALRQRAIKPILLDRATLDIVNPSARFELFDRGGTLIINCAAFTKVDLAEQQEALAYEVNGYALGEMANGARAGGVKLVHFSTDFVFDGTSREPYSPTDITHPLGVYGRSKLLGEQSATDHLNLGGDILVIRTSWLYGPNGPNFVQTMLNLGRAGKPLQVVNDQTGSPTFTHDLAEITLDLIDNDARGIYHATNSGQTTWFDFARAIFDEFDVKADLLPTTAADWKTKYPNSAPRPRYSVLDCSETERVIGRPLPDWREALHRYRLAIESA